MTKPKTKTIANECCPRCAPLAVALFAALRATTELQESLADLMEVHGYAEAASVRAEAVSSKAKLATIDI